MLAMIKRWLPIIGMAVLMATCTGFSCSSPPSEPKATPFTLNTGINASPPPQKTDDIKPRAWGTGP